MEQIYEVRGLLNQGFIGQISYSICLDHRYQQLDILFSHDKQYRDQVKSEMQLIFLLNDEFIGGIHRQDNPKKIEISKDYATKGCIPTAEFHGCLKITIVVFSIIEDDTFYSLQLFGERMNSHEIS